MADENTNTGGAGGTTDAGGGGATAWHEGMPAETVGWLQNKGFLDADPKAAVGKIIGSFQQMESLRGVPVEQLIRKPAPGDVASQRAFYEALGAPKEATGYEFAYDGHDEGGAKLVRDAVAKAAYDLGIPKTQAEAFFGAAIQAVAQDAQREAQVSEEATAAQWAALRADWGPNLEGNMFLARQAAAAFNVSEDVMDALQETMGVQATMNFFREIGVKIGEDRFVHNPAGGAPNVMTVGQAQARKAELMQDREWQKRFMAGGAPEKAEFDRITRILAGGQ